MKIRFKTQKLIVFLIAVAMFFSVVKVRAASSGFPEIMSGSTTITTSSNETVYGGLGGNYVVLNNNTNGDLGFNKTVTGLWQTGCIWQSFTSGTAACFSLGTGASGDGYVNDSRLMTSQTLVDDSVVYELPALLFNGLNVDGDVYGGVTGSGLGYLAKFWNPANLFEGEGTQDGAGWAPGSGYKLNPAAQATANSTQMAEYVAKFDDLAGSGQTIVVNNFVNASNYSLQANTSANFFKNNSKDDLAKFPDGKVWTAEGDPPILKLNRSAIFSGIGTIIVHGDLRIEEDVDILPASTGTNRLGIIVLPADDGGRGRCYFNGNNKINAMIYCAKGFNVTGNGEFNGSFVASDFSINQNQSVLFSYDPAFDTSQPPGFRTLAMPRAEEIGNKP